MFRKTKALLASATLCGAVATVPVTAQAYPETKGSWSSVDCNSTGCFYTYCTIDTAGTTGGTDCTVIWVPIYLEPTAPE